MSTGQKDTISKTTSIPLNFEYTDTLEVHANTTIYRYQLLLSSRCNEVTAISNFASNIVVNVTNTGDGFGRFSMNWNKYQFWPDGVDKYQLYRVYGGAAPELVKSFSATDSTYTDDISSLIDPAHSNNPANRQVCYYIDAYGQLKLGVQEISHSNIACAEISPQVYLPNAFNPDSNVPANQIFKPVAAFVNGYKLVIYSRWGGKVFESTDPSFGWNGRVNNKPAKEGSYVYYLEYNTTDNQIIKKMGSVLLFYK
jgi:gliding motility-associated-like protein